ncbi:MAG: YceI family protein [Saprospiraceae bacterium]
MTIWLLPFFRTGTISARTGSFSQEKCPLGRLPGRYCPAIAVFSHPKKDVALKSILLFGLLALSAWLIQPDDNIYRCDNGTVIFTSDAPLEFIQAKSNKLRGILDTERKTFAWTVDIATFDGFNSPLQRNHFNENYLETSEHAKASFAGKIIEEIDFQKNGSYPVRAKGKLTIHGIEQERIIKGTLELRDDKIRVQALFTVPLTDHDISIPKIVYQKIAEEIAVSVEAVLVRSPQVAKN